MAITEMDELASLIELREDEKAWDSSGESTLPLLISDDMVSLLPIEAIRPGN